MGSYFVNKMVDLVIPINETTSNAVPGLDDAEALLITAPAALTGTITIEVSNDGGTTYGTLQSGGSDINIAASKSVTIIDSCIKQLRLKSNAGGGETAARTFKFQKKVLAGGH